LQQEWDSLQEQYNRISQKLAHLGKANAIETDAARKFQLEIQIQETETEKKQLQRQLEEIEEQLL
jgi:Effector-associated domain 9